MPRVWWPTAIGAVIGLLSGVLGLQWSDAALVAVVAGVVAAVVMVVRSVDPPGWPAARRVETPGTRRDVSALTWAFIGLDGRVTEAAVRRLRVDASRRVAQHGVVIPGGLNSRTVRSDDADPEALHRAHALLGDRAWHILTAPGGYMPSLADVAHCIEVVERLAPEPALRPLVTTAPAAETPGGPDRPGARVVRGFRTTAPRRTDLSRTQPPTTSAPPRPEPGVS